MTHTPKKRVHFHISYEALDRLDELVNVAKKSTIRPGSISRSDIVENMIFTNSRNKIEVIDEKLKYHAKEINTLQKVKEDLLKEKEARGI